MAEANAINSNTTGIVGNTGTSITATPVTAHAIQVGGSTSSTLVQLSVGATGTVLAGSTGADPSFTATPTVTSITFGAGSALNTYVTGSFTPVLSFGGSSTGITYTTQNGEYTQIGNVVFYNIYIVLSSKGAQTGNALVGGLPVTSANNATNPPGVVQYFNGVSLPVNTGGYVAANSTSFTLYSSSTGAASQITNANFANSTSLQIAGMYWSS